MKTVPSFSSAAQLRQAIGCGLEIKMKYPGKDGIWLAEAGRSLVRVETKDGRIIRWLKDDQKQ